MIPTGMGGFRIFSRYRIYHAKHTDRTVYEINRNEQSQHYKQP